MASSNGACWFFQDPPCQYCHIGLTERDHALSDACTMICDGASHEEAAGKYGVPLCAIVVAMKHVDCEDLE